VGGRAEQHASTSGLTFVSRYDALAAMEPFHRAGQEIGRFGYVHLSDTPSIVTVTGRSSGHLHVEAKSIPQGAKIAARLNAATDVRTSMAAAGGGAVADCAGDLHLALHEAYGRSVPATMYVGGYVTDLVTVDLAAALGRLRGSGSSVCPAAMLIEDRLMPQGVLCPKINDDIGGELDALAWTGPRSSAFDPVVRRVGH
jgi:hypothetical protein